MKSGANDIVWMMRGYDNGRERFEQLRAKEIRESDIVKSLPLFDSLFRMAIKNQINTPPTPLTKQMRAYLGVDL